MTAPYLSDALKLKRLAAALLLALAALTAAGAPADPGRRVVVIVWDGMRPDFVGEQTTPNLWALAQGGVFFASHHPVYLSSTEVNGTALATGAYPDHSTVVGNYEFIPAIDPQKAVGIEQPATIRRGDAVTHGRYVAVQTLAEFLHAHGLRTAVAGSKQVALLHDRQPRADGADVSPVVYEGAALPTELAPRLDAALGAFPPAGKDGGTVKNNKFARDAWTTGALLNVLWKNGVPPFSLLWLAEPDFSQHATGPGSAQSLAAIRSSDRNLGRVLAELDRRGLRASTDVMVVSDHGFSTISRATDIATELSAAGFNAARIALGGLPRGKILTGSNGGTVFLYVGGHDDGVTKKVALWAQTRDWAGVVFSRVPVEGAFPFAAARIDSPAAPDVAVSLRWTWDKSASGTPGMICSDGSERIVGMGNHASLSATDMHNTLVAAGPDFRAGVRDPLPSGNTDLTPTILWILDFRDAALRRDGRVLGEALAGADVPPLRSFETRRLTARRETADGTWEQYLLISEVNGVHYLDEGNGAFIPKIK